MLRHRLGGGAFQNDSRVKLSETGQCKRSFNDNCGFFSGEVRDFADELNLDPELLPGRFWFL